ncbi:MAG: hypothetical protein PVSMB4_15360 [Ktedonobacterales bacterium]
MTMMQGTPESSASNAGQTAPVGNYGFGRTVPIPFDQAIARVTEALKGEGFGVLTTIDVRATMKAKLNADFEPYTILGACNPQLAHQALGIEREVGLLLPCNVVVHQEQAGTQEAAQTRVEVADPVAMLGIVRNPAMQELAQEARARLERVLAAL